MASILGRPACACRRRPDIPLLANAAKAGVTPAAPRPTTPEQDAVLDFMRHSIADGAPAH